MAYFLFMAISSILSVFSLLMLIPFLRILFYDTITSENKYNKYFLRIIEDFDKSKALLIICLGTAFLFLLKNLTRYLAQYFLTTIRSGLLFSLRNSLYKSLLNQKISSLEKTEKNTILSLFVQEAQEVEYGLIHYGEALFKEPIMMLITLITLAIMDWRLLVITVLLLPIAAIIITQLNRSLKHNAQDLQDLQHKSMSWISSTIQGFTQVKTQQKDSYFEQEYLAIQIKWKELHSRFLRRKELASPLSEFLGISIVLVVLYIGGIAVLKNKAIQAEVFITFIVVFSQIINPAKAFSNALGNIQKAKVSYKRIQEFLVNTTPKRNTEKIFLEKAITLQNISLEIEGKKILNNINAIFKKGQYSAILGTTGSGKSSLLKIIACIYQNYDGEIFIDNNNYKDIDNDQGWLNISYCPQDTVLFPISIKDNILLGKSENKEQLQLVLQIAQCNEILEKLEFKENTRLDTEQIALSGGEKQRIALARALYENKPILLLDEATSAIDEITENKIMEAIKQNYPTLTLIHITHRQHTVVGYNKIIKLENGNIID
jgi:subfamily B ATP-binding cassette protein MsbA